MLDIRFIAEHKEIVSLGARKKRREIDIDTLLRLEQARAQGNTSHMKEWQLLMLQVPNIPDITVPDGATAKENIPIRTIVGAKHATYNPSTLEMFDVPHTLCPALVLHEDILGGGLNPKDEHLVHVSETHILTPTPLVNLFKKQTSGKIHAYGYTYDENDVVIAKEEFSLLQILEGNHMRSVEAYEYLLKLTDAFFEQSGISCEVHAVCAGELLLSEVAATIYTKGNTVLARVAYHHDFIARRMRIKVGKSLAHTVALQIYLNAVTHHAETN